MRRSLFSLLQLLILSLVACGSERTPLESGQVLRIAISADIRTTEPGVLRDANTDDVLMHIVEPLLTYREDLSVAPLLAESWIVSDGGLTYDFKLREDAVFHNGQPLTAETVVWNVNRYLDPDTGWICRRTFDGGRGLRIETVTARSTSVVRFTLSQADSTFLHKLANLQCNMGIVHPESLALDGEWKHPVGTGPFALQEWAPGKQIDLVRHQDYPDSTEPRNGLAGRRVPEVDAIRWVVVPESSAARAGLVSGQLDVIYKLQVSDLFDLSVVGDVRVHQNVSVDWNALLMQTDAGPTSDRALRRAIAHAIDTQKLAEIITDGVSDANNAILPRDSSFFKECMREGYSFDLNLARKWLAESSYDRQPLRLMANRRFPSMYENAIMIQHMLGKAGIAVELEVVEWTTQLDYYARGDFQLMSFGFTGRTHPVLNYEAILGSKAQNPMYQWDDPESLPLLQRISTSIDPLERDDALCELHARMIENVPVLNLFNHHTVDAHRSNVSGYAASTFSKPRLWGVSLQSSDRSSGGF